ncbi:kinase-like domain protein [Rutstroemia sp. NJR-2017a WRK4]|nr:kinase-like domain protein [Rutstroemia sp. NJR-2017a WRK4]
MNNQVIVSERAVCRVRLPNSEKSYKELDPNRKNELHLQWANSIQQLFFTDQEPPNRTYIRNWDIVLSINDGSAENYFQDQSASSARLYPPHYQLPEAISDRLDSNEERILRTELFALGSILYEVATGHQLFHEIDETVANERVIQTLITMGMFPDDLWDLPITPRILGCWCPGFMSEMMAIRKKSISKYIKKHPYRFGFQVVGGLATVASLVAVPVLGAVGFAAAGPVAGSAAAAWQSSIGLVEAGSVFAWCQSAAMGGAALSGIIGAGVGGAGLLAGATAAGALDGADFNTLELKEKFRAAWNQDIKGK